MAKIKSCALPVNTPVLHRVAEALSPHLASAESHQRLGQLVAAAERVFPRVPEGGHAANTVWFGEDQQDHRRNTHADNGDELPQLRAGEKQHRQRGDEQDHHGTEVRLRQQQGWPVRKSRPSVLRSRAGCYALRRLYAPDSWRCSRTATDW